jgi:hypothetical protein
MDEYYRRRLAAERCYDLAFGCSRLKVFRIKAACRKTGRP